jgi:hypothetical protein
MFKERLKAEGSELVTFCHQLKMQASDGKLRNTDAVDPELSLDRAHETWQKHGRSENWIQLSEDSYLAPKKQIKEKKKLNK